MEGRKGKERREGMAGSPAYAEVVAKRREVTALWAEALEVRLRAAVAQRELDALLLAAYGLSEVASGGD